MKKFFLLLMVVTIITTSSLAQTFSDLPDGHWAKSAVEEMVKAGIISGYTDGTFKPGDNLSRIHSLLLLARIAGVRENTTTASDYATKYSSTLSKYSTQYKTDVAYLLGTGVLKESDLDELLADDKINEGLTREEMAILVTKVLGKDSEATSNSLIILSFDDASSISSKARPYVHFVNSKGYMNGVDEKNFAPKMVLTRAQAAAIFQRIYKLVEINPTTSSSTKDFSFAGTITAFDTTKKTVSIDDGTGKTSTYIYDTKTEFYVKSQKKSAASMAKKAKVSGTILNGNYISIMNISSGANVETEDITGTISTFNTTKKTITIAKSSKTYTYNYDSNTEFTLDGKSSTAAKSLVKKYEITATIEDDNYITVAKVKKPTKTITGKLVDVSKTYGYVIIEDEDKDEYILMDDYLDKYDDEDEDYYFDKDTTFSYNGSSKSYSAISSTSYLYKKGYYVEITLDDDDYITKLKVGSSKSSLSDKKDTNEIIAEIYDYDDTEGYIIIVDDNDDEYILMDEKINDYDEGDEDYYFDDDTKFYLNGSSKSYNSILNYIYDDDYYVKIKIDDDDYITEIRVASSKSGLTSSSSSSSEITDGYVYGYIVDFDSDYIEIEDDDGEVYIFEVENNCVIIESSASDPEEDLYYYDENYDDILAEDDEVVIFVSDEDDGDYYTSIIILLD